jgi:hypothetical protein
MAHRNNVSLLADVFALYVKAKNFHRHISGRHFRDYHLLLDKQATLKRSGGKAEWAPSDGRLI